MMAGHATKAPPDMSPPPDVDILLATYNGERYLAAQLDSILRQSYGGWRLLIRDDGSTDATPAIIAGFAAGHPDKVRVIADGRGNLGAKGNFSALLEAATAGYAMFADQDDVWLPGKAAACRDAMRALADRHGDDTPLLVHCDARLVDADLGETHPSYRRYQRIDPVTSRRINRALLQNVALGCTQMFNRRLIELAAPVPAAARGHDWWVSLTAAAMGRIGHLDEALVLYRQHAGNAVGATEWTLSGLARNLLRPGSGFYRHKKEVLHGSQRQAAALLARHGDAMPPVARHALARYAAIGGRNPLARRLDLIRHGIYFDGWLKNAGLFALI